jgi:Zn-dependent protease with chaperone function
MMELPLVFLAGIAAVSFGCSLLSATALGLGWKRLGRLAPAAQSRVLLAAALAPALASFSLLAAMGFDLAVHLGAAQQCLVYAFGPPSSLSAGLAILWTLRLGRQGWVALRAVHHTRSIRRTLECVSSASGAVTRILPVDEPQAFVVGMRRPRMYLSRGLLESAGSGDLESVMAHESYHIEHRDPLRRLIASIGLAFHLPGIAFAIERRLAATMESAADADAARALGDAPRVAEALVRLARLRLAQVPLGVGMLGSDLEFRVRELLSPATRPDRPAAALLVAAAAIGFAGALLAAEPVHTVFESIVRLLAG